MSKLSQEIRHSSPVEEIMGTPPRSIIRWGTGIAAIIFLMLIFLSWMVKYPYIIKADITITTDIPPAKLMARISGRIDHIFVIDGQDVVRGQSLAIMETTASYESVEYLVRLLDTVRISGMDGLSLKKNDPILSDSPGLGEIQDHYASFRKSYYDYYMHNQINFYGRKKQSLIIEMEKIKKYINRLKTKESLSSENMEMEQKKFIRDSILNSQDILPDSEFENSKQRYHREKMEQIQIILDGNSMEIELASKELQLQDILAMGEEEKIKLRNILDDDIIKLKARIDWWIQTFMLISPIDGKVTFTKFWSKNQLVNEGETVITVVPAVEQEVIGKIFLPMKGSGKVNIGHDVYIQLEAYPYLEYGMIHGEIESRSLVPHEDMYLLNVKLPSGLSTFYGKDLEFSQNMSGTAQIITEKVRLLERIIYPFKYLINKNKD